jgi:hypothetical protein
MLVSLITYAPRFNAEQENWYVDIDVSPCGAVYPFVRLGLVRFQPHAPRNLRGVRTGAEWAQIMPERTTSATAKKIIDGKPKVVVTAIVEGACENISQSEATNVVDSSQTAAVEGHCYRQ